METIESKENKIIKEVRKLKEKKYRIEQKKFIVEGFRFIHEALKSSWNVEYIFISQEVISKLTEYGLDTIIKPETKVYKTTSSILNSLCSTENPQGIVAVVNILKPNLNCSNGLYVLCDKIQDPGNLGTIIRTAHGVNALGVILTKGTVDCYNEKTLRSTMGSIFNIPIFEDFDLDIVRQLKQEGFKLVAGSLEANKYFYDEDLSENLIITVGNEGNGISEEVYKLTDIKIKIPMPGGTESLNAAVAASLIMYEALRQKNHA